MRKFKMYHRLLLHMLNLAKPVAMRGGTLKDSMQSVAEDSRYAKLLIEDSVQAMGAPLLAPGIQRNCIFAGAADVTTITTAMGSTVAILMVVLSLLVRVLLVRLVMLLLEGLVVAEVEIAGDETIIVFIQKVQMGSQLRN